MFEIREALTRDDIADAGALFREYAAFVAPKICLYDFDDEMTGFPVPYVPPKGVLLVARGPGGEAAGALGIRPLAEAGACEMKRMYVRPAYRGAGLGRALGQAALAWARGAGYTTMRLDSLPELEAAIALYTDLGFRPCAPYNPNPPDRVVFFECDLGTAPDA